MKREPKSQKLKILELYSDGPTTKTTIIDLRSKKNEIFYQLIVLQKCDNIVLSSLIHYKLQKYSVEIRKIIMIRVVYK